MILVDVLLNHVFDSYTFQIGWI